MPSVGIVYRTLDLAQRAFFKARRVSRHALSGRTVVRLIFVLPTTVEKVENCHTVYILMRERSEQHFLLRDYENIILEEVGEKGVGKQDDMQSLGAL